MRIDFDVAGRAAKVSQVLGTMSIPYADAVLKGHGAAETLKLGRGWGR